MIAQLTVLNGPLQGAIFPLPKHGMLLLGQCFTNDIQLPDRALASYHCAFVRGTNQDDQQYLVFDLHTKAGTRVNDVAITKAELYDSNIIAIGDSRLRFDVIAGETAGPLPLPPDGAIALLDAQKRMRRRAKASAHGSASPRAKLHFVRGANTLGDLALDPSTPLYFGRTRGASVLLTDAGASRHQCFIAYDVNSGEFVLYDLHTTNGTFLNGEPVRLSPLHDNDAIQIGTEAEFRFLESAAEPEAEDLNDTRELTNATLIIRRGRKKKPTGRSQGERLGVVRPEPEIIEEDTGSHAPIPGDAAARGETAQGPKRLSRRETKHDEKARNSPALLVADALRNHCLFSEAYSTLRTNLDLANLSGIGRCIAVTSPGPREGKTIVAVNLAISVANVGLKVILLEGDLRRSRLHHVFHIDPRPGLVNYLADGAPVNGHIKNTHVRNLWVLPRGSRPANPAELLNSALLADLIEDLRKTYDLIVIDTPPMLSVTDASVISPLIDGYLLVLRAGKTPRHAAIATVRQIECVHGKVLGVVLNDVDFRNQGYRYYYHQYEY